MKLFILLILSAISFSSFSENLTKLEIQKGILKANAMTIFASSKVNKEKQNVNHIMIASGATKLSLNPNPSDLEKLAISEIYVKNGIIKNKENYIFNVIRENGIIHVK